MSTLERALGLKEGETAFPWQQDLLARFLRGIDNRMSLDIPTGLGKTSVMAVWLFAKSQGARVPRRLVYVVDRRAVVDQATREAERLRGWVHNNPSVKSLLGLDENQNLPISTLRGQYVDNREWLEDPSGPAIIVGTVDMIGSRLLFEGYGVSRKMRPYQAGLLGADVLFVLDEAHLVPPFEMMLETLVSNDATFQADASYTGIVPTLKLLSLSATGREVEGEVVRLSTADLKHPVAKRRLEAIKRLSFREADGSQLLAELLAEEAWKLSGEGRSNIRVIVFSNKRDIAEKTQAAIATCAKGDKKQGRDPVSIDTELFIGARRVRERERAAQWLNDHGFLAGSQHRPDRPTFLVATSAGEVGVDLDADHMVCDLVEWERMVQRLGRVNRRGAGDATVRVIVEQPQVDKKTQDAINKSEGERTKAEQTKVETLDADRERVEQLRRPIAELPKHGNSHDASPGAIRNLKLKAGDNEEFAAMIAAATSPAPLRPALTRPVVESWSMTSLENHTGRPVVSPWLRGWVADEPQTTLLWRRWLPVPEGRQTNERKRKTDAKEFFEQAPPHLSETLETESKRVFEWLVKRTKEIQNQLTAETKPQAGDEGDENKPLEPHFVVAVTLGRALDVAQFLTLKQLTFDGEDKKAEKVRKESLERSLTGSTVVLDLRFGGLSNDGLLDEKKQYPDVPAGDDDAWEVTEFRVRASDDGLLSSDPTWRTCYRFVSRVSSDGESESEPHSWLLVEKRRQSMPSEDSRSIAADFQELPKHQQWAQDEAERLASRLDLPSEYAKMLQIAARLHDEGKQADRWQRAFSAPENGKYYAKTKGPIRFSLLGGYRHEFGSLRFVEADREFQTLDLELQELARHLVASHHGFARPLIRPDGCDDGPPSVLEGRARDVALRFAKLQRRWGPWGLAWWESLLRAADQRASRRLEATEQANDAEVVRG